MAKKRAAPDRPSGPPKGPGGGADAGAGAGAGADRPERYTHSRDQIAALADCSKPNIDHWVKRGAPCFRDSRGQVWFDPAEFTVWMKGARKGGNHGGKRPGAGRPATGRLRGEASGTGHQASAQDSGPKTQDPRPKTQDPPRSRPSVPPEVSALADLSRDELDRLMIAEKVLAERAKREALEGTLVDAEEAKAAWLRACHSAGRALRDLPRASAAELCQVLGVTPDARSIAAVREVLERAVERISRALRGIDAGEQETAGTAESVLHGQ